MKNFRLILGLVMMAIGLIIALSPGVYWFFNPELTRMELFFEYWFYYIIAMVLFVGGRVILED